jgi:hypothetical protein
MNKIKICLISLTIPPDREDGEAKFFKGIFEYLKRHPKYEVKLITGKWNYDLKDPDIIQIKILRKRFLWVPHFNYQVAKILKAYDFDIIHGNGPKGSLPIILANKKRFITTIHDLGPFETQFTAFPFEKLLIKFLSQKATYITTCSNIIRKEVNYYIPNTNINKIYNLYSAIDKKFKPYPNKAAKLKLDLNIKGAVLLYIGRVAF